VCSTTADRIARVCRAIEELADHSSEPAGTVAAGDDIADRLAAVWAMIADADPELAKRLPGYLAVGD
jgi:hypothetical protein